MVKATKKPITTARGPKPEVLKIEGDWGIAVSKALKAKPPAEPLESPKIPQRAPKNPGKKKAPK